MASSQPTGLSLLQEQRRWFELALTRVDDPTSPSVQARIDLGLGWYVYGAGGSMVASSPTWAIGFGPFGGEAAAPP